jgi:hypothetical protein
MDPPPVAQWFGRSTYTLVRFISASSRAAFTLYLGPVKRTRATRDAQHWPLQRKRAGVQRTCSILVGIGQNGVPGRA